jgi:tRNA(fMet)-specific endonuclease VapC
MRGSVLLDTSVVVQILGGKHVSQYDRAFIPVIVLGELYYGAERSGRREVERAKAEAFAARNEVLECGQGTAHYYGEIKHRLRVKGRPIPDNDIWIAALARQHRLALATRDAHFHEVEGLHLLVW